MKTQELATLHPAPAAPAPKRLLIVDDHPLVRHGIRQLIGPMPEVKICGEAEDAHMALEMMRRLEPDVALLDISMPGPNGIELIKLMLAERPKLIILMLSMHDESVCALRALRAGAKGYLMKQQAMDSVLDALRKVISGGIYVSPEFSEKLVFKSIQGSNGDIASPVEKLSDREFEVLRLFGRRKSTRAIAETLHLSVKTIETHRTHIKEKLGFRTADEMVDFAVEWVTSTDG